MASIQRTVFARLYRRAASVESLPWHREQPPALLERAIQSRTSARRALDLGCGQRANAMYLAQHGFSVVAVDFVAAALDAARTRALPKRNSGLYRSRLDDWLAPGPSQMGPMRAGVYWFTRPDD